MCHKETKEILNANDLLALMETDLDKNALKECTEEFNANGLPKYEEKDEPETELNRKNTAGCLRKVIFIRRNGDVMRWRHSGFAGSLV